MSYTAHDAIEESRLKRIQETKKTLPSMEGWEALLSLDCTRHNSHQETGSDSESQQESQPAGCILGVFSGIRRKEGVVMAMHVHLRCKSWECPYCGERKRRRLMKRIFEGEIIKQCDKAGFRAAYSIKLLTLTVPGEIYRLTHTREQALEALAIHFEKLIKALKKQFGKFHYLRVVEKHKDGFPHYHVLLVGNAIAGKEVLGTIRRLWCDTYKMGNVDLKVLKSGKHGVRYITKYLTKSLGRYPNKRKFSPSKGALVPTEKPGEWIYKKIRWGETIERLFGAEETECLITLRLIEEEFGPLTEDQAREIVTRSFTG